MILLTYLKNGDKTTGAQVQAFDSNFNELSAVAVWRVSVTKGGTPEEFNTKKRGKIYLAAMDASSRNFTREEVADGSGELALNMKQSIQLDENNLLLYTDGKKTYQLDKVHFH